MLGAVEGRATDIWARLYVFPLCSVTKPLRSRCDPLDPSILAQRTQIASACLRIRFIPEGVACSRVIGQGLAVF